MLLDPDNAFGLFVASNANPGIGNHLLEPVLTHLYGPAPTPAPPVAMAGAPDARRVAGVYLDTNRTRHDLSRIRALMPMLQSRVAADGTGGITWSGRRWIEVAPFVFQASNGGDTLVFRHAPGHPHGRDADLERDLRAHRVDRAERPSISVSSWCACWCSACKRYDSCATWRRDRDAPAARACALFVALANVVFIVWLTASLRTLGETTPLPPAQLALLALGVAAAAVAATLPAFTVLAWRERWWTRGGRVSYTLLAACAVVFADVARLLEAARLPVLSRAHHPRRPRPNPRPRGPGAAGSPGRIPILNVAVPLLGHRQRQLRPTLAKIMSACPGWGCPCGWRGRRARRRGRAASRRAG